MRKSGKGVSLIETMMAVLISMVVMSMLGGVIFTATVTNKDQGVEMSRVVVYAQDKIEALANLPTASGLGLSGCTGASSTLPASCNTTGFTASGWNQGMNPGGTLRQQTSCPTGPNPAVGYIDYLDYAGNPLAASSCSALGNYGYQRQWQITNIIALGTPGLVRIDVQVWSRATVSAGSAAPTAMLTTYVSE